MMQVMASGARASTTGGFRARLRDAYGQWAVLEASPLIGGGRRPGRGHHRAGER